MKKIMTIAMMVVAMAAFSQMQIGKNKLMAGAGLGYDMTTVTDMAGDDVSASAMTLYVPEVNYQFEAKPNDMFKLYLYAGLGYQMESFTVDGESADESAKTMDLYLNPMVKGYFANNLFAKIALPYNYMSYTAPIADAEAVALTGMNMILSGGFDNREIEIHALTPWNNFEKGMAFYGIYDMGIMASYDGTAAEELASYFGVAGYYAHMMENMMVKPYLMYKMGMNDLVDESSYLDLGLIFAKDFNEKMNMEAGLNFNMHMLPEADALDNDAYNTLDVDAKVNYYVMPELDVFGGFGVNMDLTTEDANPIYSILVGAEYTLNFVK